MNALPCQMSERDEPIRYAIYTRQPVEQLADFSSCEARFHTCRDFAEAAAEPGLVWCGQRFDDEGASGGKFERDIIATRIAESRTYRKKHGRRLAGKVVPNPVEAPRVAAIFERAAKGERPKQIADAINTLGWATKIYHSKRSGKTTGGGTWTARQIADTLRNPVYVGRFADGADTRDGCHQAIVDRATSRPCNSNSTPAARRAITSARATNTCRSARRSPARAAADSWRRIRARGR